MAATRARQQAEVDPHTVSSVPCPALLAHAAVCPGAGLDAFCVRTTASSGSQSQARVLLRTQNSISFIALIADTAGCLIAVFTGGMNVTKLHIGPTG